MGWGWPPDPGSCPLLDSVCPGHRSEQPWVGGSELLQGRAEGVQGQGAEAGPAGSGGGGSVCFQDSKCLLRGCGLHGDLVPDCVVHIDWAAAKPCHGVGEELAGAV